MTPEAKPPVQAMTQEPSGPGQPGTPLPWEANYSGTMPDVPCISGWREDAWEGDPIAIQNGAYMLYACNTLPTLEAERDALREALGKIINLAIPGMGTEAEIRDIALVALGIEALSNLKGGE